MPAGPFVPVLWLLVCFFTERTAAKKKENDPNQKALMPHHSFTSPLEYTSLLDDWSVSGASIFERERLLIHPGVTERGGFAWNKAPLHTNNFEVIVHFKVVGEKDGSKIPEDQSFGIWYVYENVSQSYNESQIIKAQNWAAGMREQGFSFSGMKASFEGIGAVLSPRGKDKKQPVVSFITNDGHTTLAYGHDLPAANAKVVDFRNTINSAQLKIRVQPTLVEAHLKQSPSLSWNECFKIDRTKHPIKVDGFVGITAWSGTGSTEISDLVSITQVEVNNFDDTTLGEDFTDVTAKIQDAYREMLTDEHRHFLDQQSQTDHLDRLTAMLSEYSNNSVLVDKKLYSDLEQFDGRVEKLGEACATAAVEVKLLLAHDPKERPESLTESGVTAMKNEIVGLRALLVKDHSNNKLKLDAVQKNVAEVKQKTSQAANPELLDAIAKQTKDLKKTVASRGSQMSWMLLCLLASIAAIGGLMWNRMRYYERKWFL